MIVFVAVVGAATRAKLAALGVEVYLQT